MREFLRNLRSKRGLSQLEIAERVGVSQGYLSRLERGLKRPSLEIALKLAELYEVPVEELFKDGEGPQEAPLGKEEVPAFHHLEKRARKIRHHILKMTTRAGSGHPSSSLSAVEILTLLYFGGFLRYDPRRPDWPDRDRFILSKGHGVPLLYAVLAEAGYIPEEHLDHLRKIGSPLEGHPNMRRVPGVEASTGSLGQGLSIGIGHALAARLDGRNFRVYVLLGDGECDEGQVWEAAMTAGFYGLDNLTAIVDHNKAQQSGVVNEVMDLDPIAAKWRAFRWNAIEVDGHDLGSLYSAFREAQSTSGKPTVLIAHTLKGKGISFVEADFRFHGKPLNQEQLEKALEEIGPVDE